MPDDTSLERVRMLRKEYELQTKGHREQVARICCNAFKEATRIQKSNRKRKQFFELVGVRPSQQRKINIVTEMMVYVIGAESKRKRAWKYGRAVQYLSEIGIPLGDLEREVKKRGGLEAVAKEAAQQQPRRRKKTDSASTTIRSTPKLDLPKKAAGIQTGEAASNRSGNAARDLSNDQKTSLLIEIQMSDLDELRELKPGERIKLITTRLREGRHLLTVNRLRKLI